MASIIDYPAVLERMTADGFRCNYPNGGAFGFPRAMEVPFLGWLGPPDGTIKPAARECSRQFPPPFESNLAAAATRAWRDILPGAVWIMPGSHWHFEMHDGSSVYLPGLLCEIGVDPSALQDRPDGSAVEFALNESPQFELFVRSLLGNLKVSDFFAAFPGRRTTCVIHHHTQLWWQSSDATELRRIEAMQPGSITP